jgi:hypothetical protein
MLFSKETALVSKETALVSKETALVSKETALVSKKTALVSKETALVSKENVLVSKETALVSKETALVSKETALVSKETALVSKETALVSKETACASETALKDGNLRAGPGTGPVKNGKPPTGRGSILDFGGTAAVFLSTVSGARAQISGLLPEFAAQAGGLRNRRREARETRKKKSSKMVKSRENGLEVMFKGLKQGLNGLFKRPSPAKFSHGGGGAGIAGA